MAFAGLCLFMAAFARAAQVHYTLDLTWAPGSPNGVQRELIFVNDRFPGPPLYADEGDYVIVWTEYLVMMATLADCKQVEVNNHTPFNTTVHFHGIEYIAYSNSLHSYSSQDIDKEAPHALMGSRV